ncbi:hypothetical protein AAFF_G00268460 [Aldrovandia affinis]|uniref:Uncharacterized protein n=1 Tax=Aldrovandia affinis TaxID=143900 RepID=A0AAD7WSN3_9TELE|nr:hypothetical protein AAFF_G00268460 [Aldrovandia affinis]
MAIRSASTDSRRPKSVHHRGGALKSEPPRGQRAREGCSAPHRKPFVGALAVAPYPALSICGGSPFSIVRLPGRSRELIQRGRAGDREAVVRRAEICGHAP